jgi:hypothetical protein
MGWTCNNHRGDDAASALLAQREAVIHGPVLAGPLNMRYLSYNPNHTALNGADHFVVALGVDDDKEWFCYTTRRDIRPCSYH